MKKRLLISCLIFSTVIVNAQEKQTSVRSTIPRNNQTVPVKTRPLADTAKKTPGSKEGLRENLSLPSHATGKYEFEKKMQDGSTIRQVLQVNEGKIARFKLEDNTEASTDIKKQYKKNPELATQKINTGWEDCTTEETRLTVDNISIMTVDYSGQMEGIYPGAVYSIQNFMKGGWNAVNTGRNPITLVATVQNTGSDSPTVRIETPNYASISSARNILFNRFTTEDKKIGSESFQYRLYEISNEAELTLKIGASGYGFGAKASGLFTSSDKKTHRYLLIDAVKSMFSIGVMPEEAGLLVNPTDEMVYISKVTYGARIIAVAEIETYSSGMDVKFTAGADYLVAGGDFSLDYISRQFGSATKINFYVVGGASDKVSSVYSFDELKSRCNEILTTLNYHTSKPISYHLKNMQNNLVKKYSATDYFLSQSCTYRKGDEAPKDIEVVAALNRIEPIDRSETDMEIYGQVWAQLFDPNGREILPEGGRDRLLDLKDNQHLLQSSFIPWYTPGPQVNARFKIPGTLAKGCKLVIYYWLMDDDVSPNDDDFLSMRNGNGTMRRYKNDMYYATEIIIGENITDPPSAEFVDRDSESGVRVFLNISKRELPGNK